MKRGLVGMPVKDILLSSGRGKARGESEVNLMGRRLIDMRTWLYCHQGTYISPDATDGLCKVDTRRPAGKLWTVGLNMKQSGEDWAKCIRY